MAYFQKLLHTYIYKHRHVSVDYSFVPYKNILYIYMLQVLFLYAYINDNIFANIWDCNLYKLVFYSWPLNNTGLSCMCHFYATFFNKYYSLLGVLVESVDVETEIWNTDYKVIHKFCTLQRGSAPLAPALFKSPLYFVTWKYILEKVLYQDTYSVNNYIGECFLL